MRNFAVLLLAAGLSSSVLAADKPSAKSSAVVDKAAKAAPAEAAAFVTVNGVPQPVTWAEVLFRQQLQAGAKDSPELRGSVRNALVANALAEQEARKQGLDKNPLVSAQMEMAKQAALVRAWEQKIMSEVSVGDAELTAEYEQQIKRLGPNEYRVRQLVVSDEATAKMLLDKVKGGAKLADLVNEYAKDKAAKEDGGLSGWVNSGNLLAPLSEALYKLPKGKLVAAPVQTQFGWHIMQLEDIRPFKAPTLEETKPQLTQILRRRGLEQKLKSLTDKASIQ